MISFRLITLILIGGAALPAWAAESREAASPASPAPPAAPNPPANVLTDRETATAHVNAYLQAKTGPAMTATYEAVKNDGMAGVRALIERFRDEMARPAPNRDVISRLSHALVKIGRPALVPVVAIFRNPAEPEPLRAEMARIVGRVQGYRSVFAMVEVLADSLNRMPSPLAARILEILGDLGDPRPYPSVERALQHEDPSVRFAAATAMGKLQDPSAFPPLLTALEDPDLAVRAAANRALVRLSGADMAYVADAPEAQQAAAIEKWRAWWLRNREKLKPPPDPLQAELWRHADKALAWAVVGTPLPLPGMKAAVAFPGPKPPADAPVLLSTEHLPNGTLPVVEGRRIVLRTPETLKPVPAEGYWRFEPPTLEENRAEITLSRIAPGEQPRRATLRYALGPEGWKVDDVVIQGENPVNPSPPEGETAPPPAATTPPEKESAPPPASDDEADPPAEMIAPPAEPTPAVEDPSP